MCAPSADDPLLPMPAGQHTHMHTLTSCLRQSHSVVICSLSNIREPSVWHSITFTSSAVYVAWIFKPTIENEMCDMVSGVALLHEKINVIWKMYNLPTSVLNCNWWEHGNLCHALMTVSSTPADTRKLVTQHFPTHLRKPFFYFLS